MEKQPIEIISLILSFSIDDRSSFSLVNKLFYKAVNILPIWKAKIISKLMSQNTEYHNGPVNLKKCIEPKFKFPERSREYKKMKSHSSPEGDIFIAADCSNIDHFNYKYNSGFTRSDLLKFLFKERKNSLWSNKKEERLNKYIKDRTVYYAMLEKFG